MSALSEDQKQQGGSSVWHRFAIFPLFSVLLSAIYSIATLDVALAQSLGAGGVPSGLEGEQIILYAACLGVLGLSCVVIVLSGQLQKSGKAIEEHKRQVEQLEALDRPTGLPNQTAFEDAGSKIARATGRSRQLVVMALDCNVGSRTNEQGEFADTIESQAEVADRLQTVLSIFDPAVVLGRGDDGSFLCLLRLEQGIAVADLTRKVTRALAKNSEANPSLPGIGCSIGAAVCDASTEAVPSLVLKARIALGEATADRWGHTTVFNPSLSSALYRRHIIDEDLPAALQAGQIDPHFLPKFDLSSGKIKGVEALARWEHPKLGWVSPREFLPAAQAMGLITSLDDMVLKSACQNALKFPSNINLSINASVERLMSGNYADLVQKVLKETGFPASRLFVEVSETSLCAKPVRVLKVLRELKALGVRVTLDDFGQAGYAALPYLTLLEWDEIKIDRNLAEQALGDTISHDVLAVVLESLTRDGILTTGKCIETPDQRDYFESLGCALRRDFCSAARCLQRTLNVFSSQCLKNNLAVHLA